MPEFVVPYSLKTFPGRGYVVTTDRTEKEIHLFNKKRAHLGKFGREGRGPGEFMGAIKLHVGEDSHLYTYDSRLRRISRFKVDSDRLGYVESYTPTQESLTWLQNIYVTEWGNFGVYKKMVEMSTGEEEFHFYKLDDEFNKLERVLTMPGNEKIPLNDDGPFVQYIDHMAGKKTLWDLDGEWFYYISSHNPTINKYNLKTGELETTVYFKLEERKITEQTRSQLMEYSSSMASRFPTVKETMEEVRVLPLFQEFEVHDQMLYLLLFDISGSEQKQTEIIRTNEETEEAHYLNIPLHFGKIQAGDNKLYGIETIEGDFSSVKVVELRKP